MIFLKHLETFLRKSFYGQKGPQFQTNLTQN